MSCRDAPTTSHPPHVNASSCAPRATATSASPSSRTYASQRAGGGRPLRSSVKSSTRSSLKRSSYSSRFPSSAASTSSTPGHRLVAVPLPPPPKGLAARRALPTLALQATTTAMRKIDPLRLHSEGEAFVISPTSPRQVPLQASSGRGDSCYLIFNLLRCIDLIRLPCSIR